MIAADGSSVPFVTEADGSICFAADGQQKSYLVPLLWYKGYAAVLQTSEGVSIELQVAEDEASGKAVVTAEPGATGEVTVWYRGTMVQKISDILTAVTWLTVAGCLIKRAVDSKRRRRQYDGDNRERNTK